MKKTYVRKFGFGPITLNEGPEPAIDRLLRLSAYAAQSHMNALDGQYPGFNFNRELAERVVDAWCQAYHFAKAGLAKRGIKGVSRWMLVSVDHVNGGLRANVKLL